MMVGREPTTASQQSGSLLHSALEEYENTEGRGRALTFGSELDLTFPSMMTVEDMVSNVLSSPARTAEPNTVSSCETQESNPPDAHEEELFVISHTPPSFSTSLEAERKKRRSDSISGRLRAASDLEDKGVIDKRHKDVLKDLIVSGDTQVLQALDQYEEGDAAPLQSLVRMSNQDIDLLGDLDLDFLTFKDDGVGELAFTFDQAVPLHTNTEVTTHAHPHTPTHSRSASTGSIVTSRLRSNTFGSLCDDIDFLKTNVKIDQTGTLSLTLQPDTPKAKTRGRPTKNKNALPSNTKPRKKEPENSKEPVPSGLGLPRTLSDPNLHSITDSDGLLHVERPDGWVGAYSPTSRKMRIERFMAKRNHRVWTKKVKYDVRKNFADSRLRVKGRFVKKEDEMLMRELLSLT